MTCYFKLQTMVGLTLLTAVLQAAPAQAECPYTPIEASAIQLEQGARHLQAAVNKHYPDASWTRVLVYDTTELARVAGQMADEARARAPLFVLRSFSYRAAEIVKRISQLTNYVAYQVNLDLLLDPQQQIAEASVLLQHAVDQLAIKGVPSGECKTLADGVNANTEKPLVERLRPFSQKL